MQLGIYHVYWRELLRLFPRDQLLILHTSELQNGTSIEMKICDFLELREFLYLLLLQAHQCVNLIIVFLHDDTLQ